MCKLLKLLDFILCRAAAPESIFPHLGNELISLLWRTVLRSGMVVCVWLSRDTGNDDKFKGRTEYTKPRRFIHSPHPALFPATTLGRANIYSNAWGQKHDTTSAWIHRSPGSKSKQIKLQWNIIKKLLKREWLWRRRFCLTNSVYSRGRFYNIFVCTFLV